MWSADLTECKGQGPGSVSWNESVSLIPNAVFVTTANLTEQGKGPFKYVGSSSGRIVTIQWKYVAISV